MDIYKIKLEEAKKNMQECQQKTQQKLSCIDCEKLCECEIRDSFVLATYNNMSRGSGTDFDF